MTAYCLHHNTYDPGMSPGSAYQWGHVSEIQSIKETTSSLHHSLDFKGLGASLQQLQSVHLLLMSYPTYRVDRSQVQVNESCKFGKTIRFRRNKNRAKGCSRLQNRQRRDATLLPRMKPCSASLSDLSHHTRTATVRVSWFEL